MPELQLTLVDKTDKHMYAANLLLKREFGHTLGGFQSTLFAQKVEAFEPLTGIGKCIVVFVCVCAFTFHSSSTPT